MTAKGNRHDQLYKPEMCEKIIEAMRFGGTQVQAAAAIGISKRTLADWIDKESPRFHDDIYDAVEFGKTLGHAYMEKYGIENLITPGGRDAPKFNHQLWYMLMKNCHGYRDSVTTTHDIAINGQVGELIKKYDRDY